MFARCAPSIELNAFYVEQNYCFLLFPWLSAFTPLEIDSRNRLSYNQDYYLFLLTSEMSGPALAGYARLSC